ncbi:endoplasmic reticulum membrane sensor NFE2L1 isoform X2 [Ascaphus truei]|uniref:endoplasmic reticulum membrane sensor NFE2L1 isoform X2 n=1 Tax=Ascaphus truei TaxID=8439 RepID=UPI003F597401
MGVYVSGFLYVWKFLWGSCSLRVSFSLRGSLHDSHQPLSLQDIDLIDILWHQDIDLGAGRESFDSRQRQKESEGRREPLGDGVTTEIVGPAFQVDGETGENIPQEDQTSLSLEECLSLLDVTFPFADRAEFPAAVPSDLLDAEQCPVSVASDRSDGLLSPLLPDSGNPLDLEDQWQDLMSLMDLQLNSSANDTSAPTLPDPLGGLLDEALLDEISLMELALEEGFSHVQASRLQEELDSDSGLSLDSSRSPVSPSGSESSSSSCSNSSSSSSSFSEEGAVGYSSESDMAELEDFDEASGYQPEYSKFCRMSSQGAAQFQHLPFLEYVGHNHTYNMAPEEPEEEQDTGRRGGRRQAGFLDRQAGRDEQRARAMKIPFSNEKIINLPVEEFNELLTKYQLSEPQLVLVRDIRRRGKNKMAAQNCRKRKLDTILNLEQEVKRLNRERCAQLRAKGENLRCLQRMKQEVESLYQEVFSQVRDQEGRPYSPQRYALQYTSDGGVVLMPRGAAEQQGRRPDRKDRRK